MKDPHQHRLVTRAHYYRKTDVTGQFVAILDWTVDDRGLELIPHLSRAVHRGDILELIATDEPNVGPGSTVNRVAYLGFVEVYDGGIVLSGDEIILEKQPIGELVGFDMTHAPNHLNVVIRMEARQSGREAGIKLNQLVTFKGILDTEEKRIGF